MTPMKSIHRILALAALAATAFLSPALHAQAASAMRINVPFAFEYADHHFTAGVYNVTLLSGGLALSVGHYGGTSVAMVGPGDEARGPAAGYLVFHKYGNRYFLVQYHQSGSAIMAEVLNTTEERSVARDFAANQANEKNAVQVALLQNGATFSFQR